MQIKAAVIQIHRSHRRDAVVYQPCLGVQKARRIAEDPDPRAQKMREVTPGQLVDRRLVGHAGRVDTHIHTALGRQPQAGQQIVVQYQVGRADLQPPLRLIDQLQINILRHGLPVHRAVGKGLHQTIGRHRRSGGQAAVDVNILLGVLCLPEGQENVGQRPRARPLQPDAAVLPIAEPHQPVDVFIGQIHAAGKADLSVNDHDLAVVAVVHDKVQHRHAAVEAERPDALRPQQFGIVVGQQAQAARIIVDDPHVQPRGSLAAQDLMDLAPHLAHADDKALDKDAVLGALQGGQHVGQHRLAVRVVSHRRAAVQRRRGVIVQIARCQRRPRVSRAQTGHSGGVLAPGIRHGLLGPLLPAAQAKCRALVAPQQVQKAALHRHDCKQDHPADLELRHGGVLPDQRQTHDDAQRQAGGVEPPGIVRQPVKQRKQPHHLQHKQHGRHNQTAEHKVQHPAQHQPPVMFFHKGLSSCCMIP